MMTQVAEENDMLRLRAAEEPEAIAWRDIVVVRIPQPLGPFKIMF